MLRKLTPTPNVIKLLLPLVLATWHISVLAQTTEMALPQMPKPKRFIDKVEVFVGPSLSFNYGNKFIENYKDENVRNKRLMKVGYTFGVGVYHPLKDWLDINLRIAYEEKGSKSKMNTPSLEIKPEYTYRYLTVCVAPKLFLGRDNKFTISLGGYYSFLRKVEGYEVVYSGTDVFKEHFVGRNIRGLRSDGSVESITYISGLRSFQQYDYGLNVRCGYHLLLKNGKSISIEINDNLKDDYIKTLTQLRKDLLGS